MNKNKIILLPKNELFHYGRRGMRWGEHIFGDDDLDGYKSFKRLSTRDQNKESNRLQMELTPAHNRVNEARSNAQKAYKWLQETKAERPLYEERGLRSLHDKVVADETRKYRDSMRSYNDAVSYLSNLNDSIRIRERAFLSDYGIDFGY